MARLIGKICKSDPLGCPLCSCRMRILALIIEAARLNGILRLPACIPPL
jgi:hypothetical protein